MNLKTVLRAGCLAAALLLAMLAMLLYNTFRLQQYQRRLDMQYLRALQEISGELDAINADLQKTAYTGAPAQMSAISARIWKSAGSAKTALGNLPDEDGSLDDAYRFLSQVGEYTMYLSRKSMNGEEITPEEWESLEALTAYARLLSDRVADMEYLAGSGKMEITEVLRHPGGGEMEEALMVNAAAGEEGEMEGYPTLIYDGPFSDHLLERSPTITKSLPELTVHEARYTASYYSGIPVEELEIGQEEHSRMPSYTFRGDEVDIGVTKQGGFVTYMVSGRPIGQRQLSIDEARDRGRQFLEEHGIGPMRESYYELSGGILTINYAYSLGDVLCYTDLIKVGIAMDDGQAVFYDARGFINNHKERHLSQPALLPGEAAASLSPNLEPQRVQLALIPTAGGGEVLAWEFGCKGKKGEDVLVYINVETGAEEQILILLENPNGTLAV